MGLLKKLFIFLRYAILCRSYVRVIGSGKITINGKARLHKVRIYIYPDANLEIGEYCNVRNSTISVVKGCCRIGDYSIIEGTQVCIDNGQVSIGHHAKLALQRTWVRFGGKLVIGDYTNINARSEIRCDENVEIGSYNMISYNTRIWDTNTHTILSPVERRKSTIEHFPYFGWEDSKPDTKPTYIGDDCWIGENAVIMKGTHIGNETIVGYGTMIIGKVIPEHSRVVNERLLKVTTL